MNNTKDIFRTNTTDGTTEKSADEFNGLVSLPLHFPDTTTKSKAKPVKATKAFLRNRTLVLLKPKTFIII